MRWFVGWLSVFAVGSVVWMWPAPWAALMGSSILPVAAVLGVSVVRWRKTPRFREPRLLVALQLINLLPFFMVGPRLPRGTPAQGLKVVVAVAAAVIAVNAWVVFSREQFDGA